jgi:hypothetical protein
MYETQSRELQSKRQPLRTYLWSMLFIACVVVGTVLVVRANKRPGQILIAAGC